MRIKKKFWASLLCVLTVVFCAVGLSACSEDEANSCLHNWSKWTTVDRGSCMEEGSRERTCRKCGETQYEVIPAGTHNPALDDGDCTTPIYCYDCGELLTPGSGGHQGGSPSCSQQATCYVCGMTYGGGSHTPGTDDGDCTTPVYCTVCGDVARPGNASHSGGKATCESRAKCFFCGKEYGSFTGHVPEEDDGDCTTSVKCTVCKNVAIQASYSHSGGQATCTSQAKCSTCGTPYGNLAAHSGVGTWVKHMDEHYLVYECCYTLKSDPAPHQMEHGVCTVCGFSPEITVTSLETTAGSRITLSVSIKDNPGITGLTATVQYNSDALTLTNATSGEAFIGLEFSQPSSFASGCKFMWDGVEVKDENIKDGEFLILTFEVSALAPAGEYSVLLDVGAYDNQLTPVALVITGGKITVNNG